MGVGAVVVVVFGSCLWSVLTADDPEPPLPPAPTMPAFFRLEQVPVDGLYYNCLTYGPNGLDCDWDHPLIGPLNLPTPTPS